MSFDLKNLELFVRAATVGGIGRAGEELGLSSTNASQRLQSLEESLNAKLINRTTRSISLTVEGETFLHHAKQVLESAEAARAALVDDVQLSGTLRLTASATFARTHITPFIPEFVRNYPNLHLDLDLSDRVLDIMDHGIDIAFRVGTLRTSALLARKIDDNPMQLVASPAYIETFGTPSSAEDLSNHSCIPFGRSRQWQLRQSDMNVVTVPISGPVTVNHGSAIAEWVLAGMGIGQASLWQAGPDLRAGRLVPVLPDCCVLPDIKIWAVRPPGPIMPKKVQVFLEFIQQKIRQTNRERYGDLIDTLFQTNTSK